MFCGNSSNPCLRLFPHTLEYEFGFCRYEFCFLSCCISLILQLLLVTLENLSFLLGREVATSSRRVGVDEFWSWDLGAIPPAGMLLIEIRVDDKGVSKDSWRVIKGWMNELMKVTLAYYDDVVSEAETHKKI